MPIEPVKIPQNVYVEDRIVGPITLKQIMIIAVGSGISYIAWSMYVKYTGSSSLPITIIMWVPAVISAAFAFLKINDISLFKMILLMLEQMNKSPVRHWEGGSGISINIVTRPPKDDKSPMAPKEITQSSRLAELSQQLEQEQRLLNSTVGSETPAAATEDADEIPEDEEEIEITATRPVEPRRISVDELDHRKSVDGLGQLRGSLPLH